MPALRRGMTAHARIDQQLADWLTANGRPCRPSRVAGWRAASLLPTATGHGLRAGDRPGRLPGGWTDEELPDAQAIGWRLIDATGRGKSTVAAALTLAGEGLPVPATTVLAAARDHMARLDRHIRSHLGLPAASELDHRVDPTAVAKVVDEHVLAHPDSEHAIARRLRHAPRSDDGADAQTVFTVLLGALLGLAPPADDTDALTLVLHALDLHHLAEPVGGRDEPRVLAGPGDAAHAIGRLGLPYLKGLLHEIRPEEVHPALRVTGELGRALAAVPAALGHRVASDAVAGLLLDLNPTAVVLRLVGWQALRHDNGGREPDIAPIVDAIRQMGWLPAEMGQPPRDAARRPGDRSG